MTDPAHLPADYSERNNSVFWKEQYGFWGDAEAVYRTCKFGAVFLQMITMGVTRTNPQLAATLTKCQVGLDAISKIGQPFLRVAKAGIFIKNTQNKENHTQLRQFFSAIGPWMFSMFSVLGLVKYLGKQGIIADGPYIKGCGALGLYAGGIFGSGLAATAGIYNGMQDLDASSKWEETLKLMEERKPVPGRKGSYDQKDIAAFKKAVLDSRHNGTYDIIGGVKYILEFSTTALSISLPQSTFKTWLIQGGKVVANGWGVFAHSGYKHFWGPKPRAAAAA